MKLLILEKLPNRPREAFCRFPQAADGRALAEGPHAARKFELTLRVPVHGPICVSPRAFPKPERSKSKIWWSTGVVIEFASWRHFSACVLYSATVFMNTPDYRSLTQEALRKNSGSFATLAAIRRASSLLSNLAAEHRPSSSSNRHTRAPARCCLARQSTPLVLRQTRAAGSGGLSFQAKSLPVSCRIRVACNFRKTTEMPGK